MAHKQSSNDSANEEKKEVGPMLARLPQIAFLGGEHRSIPPTLLSAFFTQQDLAAFLQLNRAWHAISTAVLNRRVGEFVSSSGSLPLSLFDYVPLALCVSACAQHPKKLPALLDFIRKPYFISKSYLSSRPHLKGANLTHFDKKTITTLVIRYRCTFVNLQGADLSGANLRRLLARSGGLPCGVDLSGANLSRANLSGAKLIQATLRGANLDWASLNGVDLTGANLSGASLSGANLSEACLFRANLSGANLSGANLSGAKLYGADLDGASLSGANLSGADLDGASLSGANLSGANLSGANLSEAYLFRANLSGANLSGANLSGANLSEANLFRANLSGTNLNGVNLVETSLPIDKADLPKDWPDQGAKETAVKCYQDKIDAIKNNLAVVAVKNVSDAGVAADASVEEKGDAVEEKEGSVNVSSADEALNTLHNFLMALVHDKVTKNTILCRERGRISSWGGMTTSYKTVMQYGIDACLTLLETRPELSEASCAKIQALCELPVAVIKPMFGKKTNLSLARFGGIMREREPAKFSMGKSQSN